MTNSCESSQSPDRIKVDARGLHQRLDTTVAQLKVVNLRLGTPEEQPDDFAQARELGHAVMNQMSIVYGRLELINMGRKRLSGQAAQSSG